MTVVGADDRWFIGAGLYSFSLRIASLSPAATEILFRLQPSLASSELRPASGSGEHVIVCVDQFSNFPDEAKKIPHVRGHQEVGADDLLTFAPEVVITGTVIQQKLSEELRSADFAVIHQDPRTISAIYESIRQLGTILERPTEAENLVLEMQQGFNEVRQRSRLLHRKLKVYVEEWHQPPMVSGNWVPEVIRIAGGESFPINDGDLSHEVSLQEVTAFDPDLIIISWCGAGNLADKKILLNRDGWGSLRAVNDDHVRVIDDSLLNRPGPRLVEGAQRLYSWLFEMLH